MAKLTINVPGMPASEVELKPGVNRFGRTRNNDVQISHPSVSSVHCEIVDTDGALTVKDLGSTNGTSIDGQAAAGNPFQPGQNLRLGEVGITFANELVVGPELEVARESGGAIEPQPPAPRLRVRLPPPMTGAEARPGGNLAPPMAAPVASRLAGSIVKPGPRVESFYQSIPGAFVYPFRGNGLILLLSGTAFFVAMGFLTGAAGFVGLGLGIFSCGYLFAFMQSIISTSALGEAESPAWPDFENWTESGLTPFLQLLGILVFCLGPAFLWSIFGPEEQHWLAGVLLVAGLLYLPMALLAVTIYDSLSALNPMLFVLSVRRVPLQYAATCSVLGLLLLLVVGSNWVDENLKVPLLPAIVDEFLLLYTLMVVARVVGLLYHTTKGWLAWMSGAK